VWRMKCEASEFLDRCMQQKAEPSWENYYSSAAENHRVSAALSDVDEQEMTVRPEPPNAEGTDPRETEAEAPDERPGSNDKAAKDQPPPQRPRIEIRSPANVERLRDLQAAMLRGWW